MKHFMLDIETCGTDPDQDDIIQIALLELHEVGGEYLPGSAYTRTLHTSQKPSPFIAEMHKALLPVCRRTPMVSVAQVRTEILAFFKQCGVVGPAMLMGLNATTFDVPFMVKKGYLKKEDYHYRIYELKGAFNLVCDVMGLSDKQLFQCAEDAASNFELPAGKAHEALFDCYRQAKVLNGCVRLMRRSQAV